MIKSMTGFASTSLEDERATIAVTVRTLNHRHLDLQVRLPTALSGIEPDVRSLVAAYVARGRVEVGLTLQLREPSGVEVEFNEEFVRALESVVSRARARGLVEGALTPGDLLRLPQAITIRERMTPSGAALMGEVAVSALRAVEDALSDLDSMRRCEGDHLRSDLEARRVLVGDLVERILVAADEGRGAMERRLTERVADIRADLDADETLVAQEIVRTAARADISEEVARFRGHVAHWAALVDQREPCGRKLDFLLQEMNREVNTMGAKADGLRVSELVIAAKAELEKMREQVQNVE